MNNDFHHIFFFFFLLFGMTVFSVHLFGNYKDLGNVISQLITKNFSVYKNLPPITPQAKRSPALPVVAESS